MKCRFIPGIFIIVAPVMAFAQLGGVERTAGSVTGAANGAVNGSVNGTVAGPNGVAGAAARETGAIGGQEGLSAGRALGQTTDVAAAVTQNANLAARVQPLLPSGANLPQAAAGFKDSADFLTTAHIAHDLNIPFDQLKSETTGKGHVSMEKAIAKMRPDLDGGAVKNNLKLAEHQTDRDLVAAASPGGKDRVATHMAQDAGLSSRAQSILPQGTNVESAAAGFKNVGEFLATADAANTNKIPFSDLKDRVTAGQPLGAAIHALKPDMDSASADASAKASESRSKNMQADASARSSASEKGPKNIHADASAHSSASADVRK